MSLATIIAELSPLASLLEPDLLKLEASGKAELDSLVATVSSPDLKVVLSALSAAIDSIAQTEIAKL